MEVDNLFENVSIKEIKQQNIKTRTEIERKKEELRFLVSERYRDIIDAADTIFEMKTCASEINDSIKRINNIYKDWNHNILLKQSKNDSDIENHNQIQQKLSLSSQIKLILNMPELIWQSLETKKFTISAMLYNVCQNMSIHSQLTYGKYKYEQLDIMSVFNRQWSSLSSFEATIGLVSRNFLKSTKINENIDVVLDAIISILLLEDRDIISVLKQYLSCVEHQIQDWFSPKNAYLPISQQLDAVGQILMNTISNIYELFMKNAIIDRLAELSKVHVKEMDCTQKATIYRHLPNEIALFRPVLKCYQQNNDLKYVNEVVTLSNDWLESCREKYKSSFESSFKYLTTVKSIGDIRNNLEKIFNKSIEDLSKTEQWIELENRNSTKWKEIIKKLYSSKLKEITEENISTFFASWCEGIEKFMETNLTLLNEDEFDGPAFFNYFWTEFNKDVFFHSECSLPSPYIPESSSSISKVVFETLYYHFLNFFDIASSFNKSCSFDSLVIRFKVIRPEIYQLTKIFDNQLVNLVGEFVSTINDNEDFLWGILRDCLITIVKRCLEWTKNQQEKYYIQPSTTIELFKPEKMFNEFKNDSNFSISSYQLKLIFLSQSVRTIYELLPSFQAGYMTSVFTSENFKSSLSNTKAMPRRHSKNSRLPFLPGKRINQQQEIELLMWKNWNDTIEPLKEIVNESVVKGAMSSISCFIGSYFQLVKYGLSSSNACGEICTKWMSNNTDNNELNKTEPFSLEVPTQCSWPMHILLFNISHLLSIFGAHSISRKGNDGIRLDLLKTIIDKFKIVKESEEFQENKLIQNQNVQLIFDLRFLLEIINAKSGIEKDTQDQLYLLLNEIEKRVDPFDYEMMCDALHHNLTQSISKNSSLYWLLSSNQPKKNASFGQKLEIGTTQHNLIDLVGTVGGKTNKTNIRFSMLPISGYTLVDKNSFSDSLNMASKIDNKMQQSTVPDPISLSSTSSRVNHNFSPSLQPANKSYFGRLGSSWF